MLMARPESRRHRSSDSTCMYRARTTRWAPVLSTSSIRRASASALVAGVTGTWWKSIP
ncbi:hypothetical protein D3C83_218770 [compost metagenome]